MNYHRARSSLEPTTIDLLPREVDGREQWGTWLAVSRSSDRTGVVGARLGSVDRQPAIDQESFMWRVVGLVALFGVGLIFLL